MKKLKDKTKEQLVEDVKGLRQRITELELAEAELEQAVNEKENIIATLSSGEDITGRKRIEEALHESEERYRKLFQQSVEAIYIFDPETKRVLEANNAFLDFLGYKAEEVCRLTLYDFVVHKRVNIDAYIDYILMSGAIIIGERLWRHKDGTLIDVWVTASKIRQRGKDFCFVVAHDITERKRAEEKIKESEKKFKTIFDNARDGILLAEVETQKFYLANEALCQMLDYSLDEIKTLGIEEIHPEKDLPYVMEQFEKQRRKEISIARDVPLKKKDESVIYVDINSVPITLGEKTCMLGMFRDITERKRTENELLAAKELLQTLSKSSLKTLENERRYIARELHDEIGQGLTALRINLGNMQVHMNPINESIVIVERLIEQVRNLSLDLRPSILDDLGLVPALRWYVSRLKQEAEIAVQFVADSLDHRLSVEIETACFRIAQEALTNVVRHAKARQVTVELRQKEKELQLTTSDDGIGFDVKSANERAVLGESFGLLGMQERVTLLGGTIEIGSTVEGTKVIAYFPLSEP